MLSLFYVYRLIYLIVQPKLKTKPKSKSKSETKHKHKPKRYLIFFKYVKFILDPMIS